MALSYPTYPIAPGPVNPLPDPLELSKQSHQILSNAIPGLDNLTGRASENVNNLLSGMPSFGPTQRAGAFAGVRSGMPSSDFIRNRNFDLYNEKADTYRQRGFDDFLQLLKGASGTIAPTPGEQAGNEQFNKNFQQGQIQNNQAVGQRNIQTPYQNGTTRPWGDGMYGQTDTLGLHPLFGRGSNRVF